MTAIDLWATSRVRVLGVRGLEITQEMWVFERSSFLAKRVSYHIPRPYYYYLVIVVIVLAVVVLVVVVVLVAVLVFVVVEVRVVILYH